MDLNLHREDLVDFLWLQTAIENLLEIETRRRAHEAGRVPEGSILWGVEVTTDKRAPGVIEVHYRVRISRGPRGLHRVMAYDETVYHETYTLAEALALCLAPPPK